MMQRKASFESSWSWKFILIGIVVKRGSLDEFNQAIVYAARSVDGFLQPGGFVNQKYVWIPNVYDIHHRKSNPSSDSVVFQDTTSSFKDSAGDSIV